MPTIYAELSITSKKTNLREISKITGITPADEHEINEITDRGYILDHSLWRYETEIFETYDMDYVSSQFLMTFKDSSDDLSDFIHKNECDVIIYFVIGDVTDEMPVLTISKEMIKFAARLNANIDFDGHA